MRAVLLAVVLAAQANGFIVFPSHSGLQLHALRVPTLSFRAVGSAAALTMSTSGWRPQQAAAADNRGHHKSPVLRAAASATKDHCKAAGVAVAVFNHFLALCRRFILQLAMLASIFFAVPTIAHAARAAPAQGTPPTLSSSLPSVKALQPGLMQYIMVVRAVSIFSGVSLAAVVYTSYVSSKRGFQGSRLKGKVQAPLWSLFESADVNNDGKLDFEEVAARLGHVLDEKSLRELFKKYDVDGNGKLDRDEFVKGLASSQRLDFARLMTVPSVPAQQASQDKTRELK